MIQERCAWVNDNPLYTHYHDHEWGIPVYDERLLFEFLILEGMQAGLNWLTILKKRDNFRTCFDNFDAEIIANYDQNKIIQLMGNTGIIRNRLKIQAAIVNAQAFLRIRKKPGDFSSYIWGFVNGEPLQNHWEQANQVDLPKLANGKVDRPTLTKSLNPLYMEYQTRKNVSTDILEMNLSDYIERHLTGPGTPHALICLLCKLPMEKRFNTALTYIDYIKNIRDLFTIQAVLPTEEACLTIVEKRRHLIQTTEHLVKLIPGIPREKRFSFIVSFADAFYIDNILVHAVPGERLPEEAIHLKENPEYREDSSQPNAGFLFQACQEKTKGANPGAIYTDQEGALWLGKLNDAFYTPDVDREILRRRIEWGVVREKIALDLYTLFSADIAHAFIVPESTPVARRTDSTLQACIGRFNSHAGTNLAGTGGKGLFP